MGYKNGRHKQPKKPELVASATRWERVGAPAGWHQVIEEALFADGSIHFAGDAFYDWESPDGLSGGSGWHSEALYPTLAAARADADRLFQEARASYSLDKPSWEHDEYLRYVLGRQLARRPGGSR